MVASVQLKHASGVRHQFANARSAVERKVPGGCRADAYPKPDRSDFTPNFRKTAENDVLDVGWAEGVLSEGRPYRLECWAQDQLTLVTIFVSQRGLEALDDKGIGDFVERENLVRFSSAKRFASARPMQDPGGNDLLSINVVVGDENGVYATGGPALQPYLEAGA